MDSRALRRAGPAGLLAAAVASIAFAAGGDPLAPVGNFPKPPMAVEKPVTETQYGQQVTDRYRYMEAMDAATVAWMKAQGAYTRSVLDAIRPRAALERRIAAFSGSFGFVNSYASYGGNAFYLQRVPGSDNFDLFVRDAKSERRLVDVAALRAANGGKPFAINFFAASPDGTKVAVGISQGGSEDASTWVYDVATGKQIAGPIDRTQFGSIAWTDDGTKIYLNRLQRMRPDSPPTDKYQNSTVQVWDLHSEPRDILGATLGHGPKIAPTEFPIMVLSAGTPTALFVNVNGVQNEIEVWTAPLAQADDPKTQWWPAVARSDDVTAIEVRGNHLFLLSHHNAPTFQVLQMRIGERVAQAKVLLEARPDRVIESIHAAKDALYVVVREGVYARLLRISAEHAEPEEIALPVHGGIGDTFTDQRVPGMALALESWTVPPTMFHYDSAVGRFADMHIGSSPAYDPAAFTVSDLQAKASDGVMVPETLVAPKGARGPQIVLVDAYGSYGISQLPVFSPRIITFMQEGADYAVCHVRGGGELGDAWRLAGKDANKPNTWRDLIACGEDLIARGVTTRDKLFIIGGSAGGITMGRAMTERPDLFAGVIDQVPAANTLRAEFSANGPDNIPEFGTTTTEQGFHNLFAMDSIQAVRDGTRYPPVMITTGLNDPRVSPWEPAKFAARLQASGTPYPVLLRVEVEAGHGIGSTKTQRDEEFADVASFIFWRAGRPEWRPTASASVGRYQ